MLYVFCSSQKKCSLARKNRNVLSPHVPSLKATSKTKANHFPFCLFSSFLHHMKFPVQIDTPATATGKQDPRMSKVNKNYQKHSVILKLLRARRPHPRSGPCHTDSSTLWLFNIQGHDAAGNTQRSFLLEHSAAWTKVVVSCFWVAFFFFPMGQHQMMIFF